MGKIKTVLRKIRTRFKNRKRLSKPVRILVIFFFVLFFSAAIFSIIRSIIHHKDPNAMTAKEWFACETGYMNDMKNLASQLDSTVSLYINGNIDESAYLEQLDIVRREINVFLSDRKAYKDKKDIDIDSYDYANKAGVEAAENSYSIVKELTAECMKADNYMDKNKLSYLYIAYIEKLTDELAVYQECLTAEFYDEMGGGK